MPAIPDGWFVNDMIWQGSMTPSKETFISRGVILEAPDMRSADTGTLLAFKDQINYLLAYLGDEYAMQVQWSVDSDYHNGLERYHRKTLEIADRRDPNLRWCELVRRERYERYRAKMERGELRRERVRLYFGKRCNATLDDLASAARYEAFIETESRAMRERLERLQDIFTFGRIIVMDDAEHYMHATAFLNPSLVKVLPGSRDEFLMGFDPESRSYLSNCLRGDGKPFIAKRERFAGLRFDNRCHALFVVRRWPKFTEPGLMNILLGAVSQDIAITQNIYPLNIDKEIEMEETERAELIKQITDPKKYYLKTEIERKQQKITALMLGQTIPFNVLTVIRVWDETEDGLATKCLRVKTALNAMRGLGYHQVNGLAQAKNLFFETFPGFLGGRVRGWDIYGENNYLSDMMPLSSTFTGHLDEADILLDSTQGGLVGLRTFARSGASVTPQHALLAGMRGAGKSSATIENLSQTDHQSAFTSIMEEGLSYGTYAQLNGYQSLILKPDSEYTFNYLDTDGLPLTAEQVAESSALLTRLVPSADMERNQLRAGIFTAYMQQLYTDFASDWKLRHEQDYNELSRMGCAVEEYRKKRMPPGSPFMDAFVEMRDGLADSATEDEFRSYLAAPSEMDVVMFGKRRETEQVVRNLVFSRFGHTEFPIHDNLCMMMRYARFKEHRSPRMTDEMDALVTGLSKWRRIGGSNGCFVDGYSNVEFAGRGIHAELGYLGDGETELKTVAAFLLTSKIRKRIVSLPRALEKRVVWEELAKFLQSVPNGKKIIAENYAQFRKYNAWVLTVFQQFAQLDDPQIKKILTGNSTQFWVMRQGSPDDLADFASASELPARAMPAIMRFPLPEHQKTRRKATYYMLHDKGADPWLTGACEVEVSPAMLYVASSNGKTFDDRSRVMARYKDPLEAVIAEVTKQTISQSGQAA